VTAIVRTIRHKPLRHRVAVKYVWFALVSQYDLARPQTIKVRPTALALGLKVRTMRRALRLLVVHRYLDVVVAPTRGTPGDYIAGPRAYRLPAASVPVPTPRRANSGPAAPLDSLPLFSKSA
jgi:hypothetical protein